MPGYRDTGISGYRYYWNRGLIVYAYRGGSIISIGVVISLEIGATDFGKPDVSVLLEGDGHQIGQFELAMKEVCSIIVHVGEEYAGRIDARSIVKSEFRLR